MMLHHLLSNRSSLHATFSSSSVSLVVTAAASSILSFPAVAKNTRRTLFTASPKTWSNNYPSSLQSTSITFLSSSSLISSSSSPSSLLNSSLRQQQQQQQQQQRRTLFIQTASTPNPESLKFIPNGRLVLGHNSTNLDTTNLTSATTTLGEDEIMELTNSTTNIDIGERDTNGIYLTRKDTVLISRSPLAKLLFNLDTGIKSIYLGYDFVTVTKFATAHWTHLQTPIFGILMDFYASGQPTIHDAPIITDTTILDTDDEIVAMIKELLETRIRPAVQEDGGDIKYIDFDDITGVVTVQLAGSCVGCPSSSVTLKNGVENMLMHYIPEVKSVISLEEEEDEEEGGEDTVVVEKTGSEENGKNDEEKEKMKTYQDKLAAAGIPFSD